MKNLLIDLEIAARNLVQHRKRTVLLGGALAGVTALLVLLLGLSTGIHQSMVRSATTLSAGHLNVGGFYKISAGQAAPVVTDYRKVVEDVRRVVPDVDYVVTRGRGWAKAVSETGSMQVGIGGIDVEQEPGLREVLQLDAGSLDALKERNTILLFAEQAKKLEVKVGDALTISASTMRGINNTVDVRVVAIAKDMGLLSGWSTFMPNESLRELYQFNKDATGALHVMLKDTSNLPLRAAQLRTDLEAAGYRLMPPDPRAFFMKFDVVSREDWTGQKLDVTTWEDEVSFLTWTLKSVDYLSVMLIGILMVIVVIGIMNTMWIAIRERTREIGTLRAIGMHRGRVLRMFLCEAGLLGLLGTSVGALAGALV
ncbi:MAG: ABC transporter permease, partial [Myxococcales bacterium]